MRNKRDSIESFLFRLNFNTIHKQSLKKREHMISLQSTTLLHTDLQSKNRDYSSAASKNIPKKAK